MIPYLFERFDIYCIDILGMGLSSRPQVKFGTAETYLDFMVNSIEAWRKAVNLNKFYLLGHSLGGYFAGVYALRYPQHITRLTLLSAVGITDTTEGGRITERMDKKGKRGVKFMNLLWNCDCSLKNLHSNVISKYFIHRAVFQKFNIPEEERVPLQKCFHEILYYPADLTNVFFIIFKPPAPTAVLPLEKHFCENLHDYKIDFYYGANDWNECNGAKRIMDKSPLKYKLISISDSGHHLIVENPKELCDNILINYSN